MLLSCQQICHVLRLRPQTPPPSCECIMDTFGNPGLTYGFDNRLCMTTIVRYSEAKYHKDMLEMLNSLCSTGLKCLSFSSIIHYRRRRCLLAMWRWLGRKWKPFPMPKQYWKTSGLWERTWSKRWKPRLKSGHFRQHTTFARVYYTLGFDTDTFVLFVPYLSK